MNFDALLQEKGLVLNAQQLAATKQIKGPTLLCAVPGSGKTTVLICRLGRMIFEEGIDPRAILTMTFSRSAARDMQKRYESLFGHLGKTPKFSTIHSFAYRVVRSYEKNSGVKGYTVAPDTNPYARQAYIQTYGKAPEGEYLPRYISALCRIKNSGEQEWPKKLEAEEKLRPRFTQFFNTYETLLHGDRRIDFEDMLHFALKLLKKYPQLLKAFRETYHYICLDEAQDTSPIQFELISLLCEEHHNLFMVGDEDQSIYGFRGAVPDEMLHFAKRYPEATVLYMEENYRSTGLLVTAADRFISQTENRYDKHMHTAADSGIAPIRHKASSYEEMLTFVISEIRAATAPIGILYRSNNSAIHLVHQLDLMGIPFQIKGHDALFFENRICRDCLDFWNSANDPGNFDLFERCVNKTMAYVSKRDLEDARLGQRPGERAADALIRMSGWRQTDAKYRKWEYYAKILKILPDATARHFLDYIRYDLEYEEYWHRIIGQENFTENSFEKLYETLWRLTASKDTAKDFFERCEEIKTILSGAKSDPNSLVTLSSIHSAKGLEFDTVILIDAWENYFPMLRHTPSENVFKDENMRRLEEEQRLFYVAVTRAKKRLIITEIHDRRARIKRRASRFIPQYFGEKKKGMKNKK